MNDSPTSKCAAMSNFRLCSCLFEHPEVPLKAAIAAHKWMLTPIGWLLKYTALSVEQGRRLCSVSFCTKCRSLYCESAELPDGLSDGQLLAFLYELLYSQVQHSGIPKLCDSRERFGEEFLRLFADADKPIVSDWLALPENETIRKYFP